MGVTGNDEVAGDVEDKIPKFDGSPELLPIYKERAVQYAMGVEYHKRYLCGPRLLQSLSGVAKAITRPPSLRDPQWLSHPRGVYTLLEFLEKQLGRPSLVEASRHVMKVFYNMSRQKVERCHAESLWEASSALHRAQKERERENPKVRL